MERMGTSVPSVEASGPDAAKSAEASAVLLLSRGSFSLSAATFIHFDSLRPGGQWRRIFRIWTHVSLTDLHFLLLFLWSEIFISLDRILGSFRFHYHHFAFYIWRVERLGLILTRLSFKESGLLVRVFILGRFQPTISSLAAILKWLLLLIRRYLSLLNRLFVLVWIVPSRRFFCLRHLRYVEIKLVWVFRLGLRLGVSYISHWITHVTLFRLPFFATFPPTFLLFVRARGGATRRTTTFLTHFSFEII